MSLSGVKQSFNNFGVRVKNHFQKEETKEHVKKGLIITAIAIACIAGLVSLCVFVPVVGIPLVLLGLVVLTGASMYYDVKRSFS